MAFPVLSGVLLLALTIHTSGSSFVLHFCKASSQHGFTPANVVLVSEMFKLYISIFLAYLATGTRDVAATWREKDPESLLNERCKTRLISLTAKEQSQQQHCSGQTTRLDTLKKRLFNNQAFLMAIPAGLYVIQNNLRIYAASRLEPSTFQVLSELKLISTAIASTVILKKRLDRSQWFSILLLMLGVVIVQSNSNANSSSSHHDNSLHLSSPSPSGEEIGTVQVLQGRSPYSSASSSSNDILGLVAMIMACTTSGIAGVYLEKLVEKGDLWSMNSQLSFFSLIPAFSPALYAFVHLGAPLNPFHGFNEIAWLSVFSQVSGGLIVSLVIKYCGNIHKNFSQGAAIVMSYVAGVFFLGGQISTTYVTGCLFVIMGTLLYNMGSSSSATPKPIRLEDEKERPLPRHFTGQLSGGSPVL